MGTTSHEAEGAGTEDDSPLHEQRGEHLDDLAMAQGREQDGEVHVLQPRV